MSDRPHSTKTDPFADSTLRSWRHRPHSPAGTLGALEYDVDMPSSEALTRGVRVRVESRYSPDHSHPASSRWFFLYTITITNEGTDTVQLVSRHWIITDATGEVEEVRGPGVVGQQPVLEPGRDFEYTSGCPLASPYGSMQGTYQMVTASGDQFDVEIAMFALQGPYVVH